MSYGARHTVLLIEEDASLRRLMALGLQYRGMRVIEASSPGYLPAVQGEQLDLLLLDVDGSVGSDWSLLTAIQTHSYLSTLPVVVIAWEDCVPGDIDWNSTQMHITCLTKPFDARALHATIEQLLVESAPQKIEAALGAEEVLLITHAASPAPSIWPIITAAALLLTFIGLMIHISVTIVGILIFLIALLGWTLGKKPEAVASTQVGM